MADLKNSTNQKASDFVHEAAVEEASAVLQRLGTSLAGLSEEEAAARLEKYGPNEVAQEKQHGWLPRLWIAVAQSAGDFADDSRDFLFRHGGDSSDEGTVMFLMVVLGLSLRFIQETKADNAAAKLKAMIKVTATVIRDGRPREIPLKELVPGDIVKLVRRRHDSRRCAADCCEGFVHHPGHADRRIVAGRKNRRTRLAHQCLGHRTHEHLFPRHQRGSPPGSRSSLSESGCREGKRECVGPDSKLTSCLRGRCRTDPHLMRCFTLSAGQPHSMRRSASGISTQEARWPRVVVSR